MWGYKTLPYKFPRYIICLFRLVISLCTLYFYSHLLAARNNIIVVIKDNNNDYGGLHAQHDFLKGFHCILSVHY